MERRPRVLILSTRNSTRSQMAEGFLRYFAGANFLVDSTGTESVERDPLAIDVMREAGIEISGQRSRTVKELFHEHFGYVISVFDEAKERSPVFPFTPNLVRWSLPDPSEASGSLEERKQKFRCVRDELGRRVREFVEHGAPDARLRPVRAAGD
jgi:arsenate reductase (thioredoxin)